MISNLFNTSTSLFGNVAMQAARLPLNTPVEMRLGAHGPSKKGAYSEVSNQHGFFEQIPLENGRLDECGQEEGTHAVTLCQQLVDDLAARIRLAVKRALQGSAST